MEGIQREVPYEVLFHLSRLDSDFFGGGAVGTTGLGALGGDGIDGGEAFIGDLAKVGVKWGQWGVLVVQEELGTVRTDTGVGHSDGATLVIHGRVLILGLIGGVLIGEVEARATSTVAARVTTLQDVDAVRGNAVAHGVVVVAIGSEVRNGVDGTGADRTIKSHGDVTLVRHERDINGAGSRNVLRIGCGYLVVLSSASIFSPSLLVAKK